MAHDGPTNNEVKGHDTEDNEVKAGKEKEKEEAVALPGLPMGSGVHGAGARGVADAVSACDERPESSPSERPSYDEEEAPQMANRDTKAPQQPGTPGDQPCEATADSPQLEKTFEVSMQWGAIQQRRESRPEQRADGAQGR